MAELPKDEPAISSAFLFCPITWINYEMNLLEDANAIGFKEGNITLRPPIRLSRMAGI